MPKPPGEPPSSETEPDDLQYDRAADEVIRIYARFEWHWEVDLIRMKVSDRLRIMAEHKLRNAQEELEDLRRRRDR